MIIKCMVRKMIKRMAVMYIFVIKRPETYECAFGLHHYQIQLFYIFENRRKKLHALFGLQITLR